MNGALGQFGTGGMGAEQGMATPATSPLVNPASMQPAAMANMMGSPLSNGGANMMPYLSMQEQFAPKALQSSASAGNDAGYAGGGLVSFAEGGMPPMQQDPMAGAPPPGGLPQPGAPGMEGEQGGGGEGELDPRIMQEVERIFTENMEDPKAISDHLLQFLMQEIQAAVSPEQMEEIKSPEGQAMLKQELEKMMAQMQGGLGGQGEQAGAEGGGMPPQGAPPPGAGAAPAPGGGLAGMMG